MYGFSMFLGYKVSRKDYFNYVDGDNVMGEIKVTDDGNDDRTERSVDSHCIELSVEETHIIRARRFAIILQTTSLPQDLVHLVADYDNGPVFESLVPMHFEKNEVTHDVDEYAPLIIGLRIKSLCIKNSDGVNIKKKERKGQLHLPMLQMKFETEQLERIAKMFQEACPKFYNVLTSFEQSPSLYFLQHGCCCCN